MSQKVDMETQKELTARVSTLEQALRNVNEIVQGTANNLELQIHVHALVNDALLQPGEIPVYGKVLPWHVKAGSEGTEVFRIKANAEAFRALILREYPSLGYGTSTVLRRDGEMYWAVDYVIGSAD